MYKIVIALFALFFWFSPASAQSQRNPCYYTTTPGASGNTGCIPVSASNPLPVNASVSASISGFPGTTQTTGTPISVTTGGVTGTLPSGAVVVATNIGSNAAYCKLGASATTSDQQVAAGGWFAFTVGSNTQLTCITSTSTTTVNMVGGTGLPTGAVGGSSGGGGGGTSSSFGSTFPATGTAIGATDGTNMQALKVDGSNNLLAKINTALPAGANVIGKVGIDQTTPGTTNGVQLTSGTAIAGKVGIDQTTDGTTNAVHLVAGTAIAGKVGVDQTTPGTTNGVSIAQIGANTVNAGHGTAANSLRVELPTDGTGVVGLNAGSATIGNVNSAVNVTATDCSGTIATGGTAQNAFTAQTTLHGFTIVNFDTSEPLWISFTTTAAANTIGSYPLQAATATTFAGPGSFTSPTGFGLNHALSVIAATTSHKFSCTWW